ncbi:MAG: selenium metabolism-associated LysR family transcriptional regulator [Gaiellales bacterium]
MDTKQLAALVAVVDRSSFSQAAEQLGVTQPAVSLAIRSLEKRLGCQLIDRSGRVVEPTEAGQVAYRHAQRILGAERDLMRSLEDEGDVLAGNLIVGASTGPGERILPALLGAFHRENPEVAVSLRVDDTETIVDRVLDRQLEIGIVGAERAHRSLVFEPFLRDEVVLVVPAGHPLAGRMLSADELVAAPLVVQQEGAGVRTVVERELRALGVRARDLNVVAELGLQESAKSAVEAGLGITFLSRLAVEHELAEGRLATATVKGLEANRLFYAVRSAARPPGRLVATFLDFARQTLGERAAFPDEVRERPVRGGRVG